MAELQIRGGASVLVDDEDVERLSKWPWQWYKGGKTGGYAKVNLFARDNYNHEAHFVPELPLAPPMLIDMAHAVLGVSNRQEVDHINRHSLDNRECNLRPCTRSQNMANKGPRVGKKYKGVKDRRTKQRSTWFAYATRNGQRYERGPFETEDEAALAYNALAYELWGEFAYQNEVPTASP